MDRLQGRGRFHRICDPSILDQAGTLTAFLGIAMGKHGDGYMLPEQPPKRQRTQRRDALVHHIKGLETEDEDSEMKCLVSRGFPSCFNFKICMIEKQIFK